MEDVEVPQFFICPISLQIMRDPVTVVSGITYDRESIEKWFSSGKKTNNYYCPVTKQILPKQSDNLITPNHTLRRLIQAWCTANSSQTGPKSPLAKTHLLKLLQDLCVANPQSQLQTLKKLETLANENESNRRSMAEAGVSKSMASIIITCFNRDSTNCLEEALRVLNLIVTNRMTDTSFSSSDFLDSITWVLRRRTQNFKEIRSLAVSVLKSSIELEPSYLLERLKPELFEAVVWVLRDRLSQQATKAALQFLLETCPWGRNRIKIIQAGAVFHLIELELIDSPDNKRTTELIFGVLDHLCSCADGRSKFLNHAAGIAMITKRILRVSHAVDDRAVRIFSSICKFSATGEVVQEMLRVGAVSKLCMILQAESAPRVKAKARDVLRLHSNVWSNSPCIHVYLLTRYPIR